MLNTSPRDTKKQACHAANEQTCAYPVHTFELLRERKLCHRIEAHKEDGDEEPDTTEGVIDVEAPTPRSILDEGAADDRADDGTDAPGAEHHSEKLRALPQGNDVTEDDLGERDDTAAADTLDASPCEQYCKVAGHRTKNCAYIAHRT